jgi:RecJ-like exonuclease
MKGTIIMNESCELCGKETNGSLWWLCKDDNGDYKDYVCICADCDNKQTEKEL